MSTKILACLLAAVLVTAGGSYYYVSTVNGHNSCGSCSKSVTNPGETCTKEEGNCCAVAETKSCCSKDSGSSCCDAKLAKLFADEPTETPTAAVVGVVSTVK